jgi:predicted RNA methylase
MNPPDLSRLHTLRDANDLHAATMELNRGRFEALRTRHEDGTAPRAVSAYQLFQTPPALAARMVELAEVKPGDVLLEPSAGLGRIIDPALAAGARVLAVEVSPDLSGELFRAYEGKDVRLLQRDFLTVRPAYEGNAALIVKDLAEVRIDRVVMNPPFHMRADIAHVRHALRFLRPSGVLVGLCLSTRHRTEALQPLADLWEVIPAGTFKGEGTNVETVLFRITG